LPIRRDPEQLDFDALLAGADQAAGHGDDWWRAGALAGNDVLAASGNPFTSEQLVGLVGPPQGSQNQLGSVFLTASRAGVIVSIGAVRSPRPGRKAGLVRQWVGAEFAQDGAA
jgi:hypothetical protein